MKEDLTTNLVVLESHLESMLDRVQQNGLTLKRFQNFEMGLLKLNSLAEMIEHVLEEARTNFNLDDISFCLIDENGDISRYLSEDRYDYKNREGLILLKDKDYYHKKLGLYSRPYVGAYNELICAPFFTGSKKPESVAVLPLSRRGRVLGSLNLGSYDVDRFTLNMATDFIEHMISVVSICLENNLNFETMRRTSLIDTLTGVNNRLFLEQRIDEELDRSQRNNQPLTCLFLDIDFFKRINDQYGHQVGDEVLAMVATTIKNQMRSNDVLARFGGEEFIALLNNIDENKAVEIAERIRQSIKALTLKSNDQSIPVTISIGSATYRPSDSQAVSTSDISEALIKAADVALYQAKNNGRDRVENAGVIDLSSLQSNNKIA